MVIAARFEESPQGAGAAREPRRMLRLEAEGITAAGDAARGLVHNISANGLLLESAVPLATGERLDIDLPYAGQTAARVVWASGEFFGCQFEAPLSTAALSAAQLRSEVPEAGALPLRPAGPAGESFGARLHRLRKERGLTLSQLAAQLGVSKPTVWAWEQGKARPVEERLAALAAALDVPEGDMMPGRGAPILADLVARTRDQIATTLGVAPDKVRITVDL